MDTPDASSVIAKVIEQKLVAHHEKEAEHVEALVSSQKHLTSNVRTLINSLDQILALTTPKYSSSQSDMLHSCVSRAKVLQKQLLAVQARMQRIQAHLQQQPSHSAAAAAAAQEVQQQPSDCAAAAAAQEQQQQQLAPDGQTAAAASRQSRQGAHVHEEESQQQQQQQPQQLQ